MIKQLQEAVGGYKDLDVAPEIEKVDYIDESLQEKILTRLACKEAQKFKAAFTRFERTATLPTQIHKNMGLNVSLNTDKFYASFVSGDNDEALATITTARMMQAQSLVVEAALSDHGGRSQYWCKAHAEVQCVAVGYAWASSENEQAPDAPLEGETRGVQGCGRASF